MVAVTSVDLGRSAATVAAAAAVLARHPEQVPSAPGRRLLHRLEVAAHDLAVGLPRTEKEILESLLLHVAGGLRDRDFLYEHPRSFRAGVDALADALASEIQKMQPARAQRAS